MVTYLSDEWMQRAATAFAGQSVDALSDTEAVSLAYEVTGAPQGTRRFSVRIASSGITLTPDRADDATATFTLDYDTAAAIAQGQLAAQAAFMQGRLKLGGDVNVLIRQHAAVDGFADALATLRSETEF